MGCVYQVAEGGVLQVRTVYITQRKCCPNPPPAQPPPFRVLDARVGTVQRSLGRAPRRALAIYLGREGKGIPELLTQSGNFLQWAAISRDKYKSWVKQNVLRDVRTHRFRTRVDPWACRECNVTGVIRQVSVSLVEGGGNKDVRGRQVPAMRLKTGCRNMARSGLGMPHPGTGCGSNGDYHSTRAPCTSDRRDYN